MHWEQRFKLDLKATGADSKTEDMQVTVLRHFVPENGLEVRNTFHFMDGEANNKLEDILKKLAHVGNPQKKHLLQEV